MLNRIAYILGGIIIAWLAAGLYLALRRQWRLYQRYGKSGRPKGNIAPDFMKTRSIAARSLHGYDIWGPVNPPLQLGIHGTAVAVDQDLCVADGSCLDVCEVDVFQWVPSPGHPRSERKSAPVYEKRCTFCTACESVCPAKAIKITMLK